MLLDDLKINYQEGCLGNCILAGPCKSRYVGKARLLGDAAADLLGADTDLSRPPAETVVPQWAGKFG